MTTKKIREIVPEATIAIGTLDDFDDCFRLRTEIALELEQKGTPEICLANDPPEIFRSFFDDQESRTLIIRDLNGELVGFGIATYRGEPRQKFRALIPEFDVSLHCVVYVKLIQVAPKFRGHRLQCVFLEELEIWAHESGSSFAAAIVSPHNLPSLKNFLRCGYREAERFTFESSGYERIRMIKKLVLPEEQ